MDVAPITTRRDLDLALMLALTFTTGVVDAVGYLGLDRVFTANMTGNVVILGMGTVGAAGLPILGPIVALAFFFVGAAIAGRSLRHSVAGWSPTCSVLLGVVGAGVCALAVSLLVVGDTVPALLQYVVTAILAAVMGIQAGTARQIAVQDVSTVVVTSSLAGLAFDSLLGAGRSQQWFRRAAAVTLIGLGAVAGSAMLRWHLGVGLAVSGIIILTVAIVGHVSRFPAAEPTS